MQCSIENVVVLGIPERSKLLIVSWCAVHLLEPMSHDKVDNAFNSCVLCVFIKFSCFASYNLQSRVCFDTYFASAVKFVCELVYILMLGAIKNVYFFEDLCY